LGGAAFRNKCVSFGEEQFAGMPGTAHQGREDPGAAAKE
jgi:hypothetical protein